MTIRKGSSKSKKNIKFKTKKMIGTTPIRSKKRKMPTVISTDFIKELDEFLEELEKFQNVDMTYRGRIHDFVNQEMKATSTLNRDIDGIMRTGLGAIEEKRNTAVREYLFSRGITEPETYEDHHIIFKIHDKARDEFSTLYRTQYDIVRNKKNEAESKALDVHNDLLDYDALDKHNKNESDDIGYNISQMLDRMVNGEIGDMYSTLDDNVRQFEEDNYRKVATPSWDIQNEIMEMFVVPAFWESKGGKPEKAPLKDSDLYDLVAHAVEIDFKKGETYKDLNMKDKQELLSYIVSSLGEYGWESWGRDYTYEDIYEKYGQHLDWQAGSFLEWYDHLGGTGTDPAIDLLEKTRDAISEELEPKEIAKAH